jgi:alcohol dehydrogenase
MNQFVYYAPTKVYFGKGQESHVTEYIKQYGGTKVLLHYGGHSAERSGLLDRIKNLLEEAGLAYVCLGGVVANPVLSKVEEGIALCKKGGVDFILAIGGGSVIDSAKAIGYGVVNEGNLWDYYEKKRAVTGCLPIGCVLTIAAAGSEMSNSSVITNENGQLKRGLTNDYGRCRFAIMNPELTYTLPPYQSMSGAVDIMMHTLERFFVSEEPMEIYDHFALGVLKTVVHHAPIVLKEPMNYESRSELMWASSCSHNGMSGPREIGDWACHQLEHELSGKYGVAHGAGLSAVWGSWARYVYEADVKRFAKLARELFDMKEEDDHVCALKGIEAMEAFFTSIQMPISLHELGLEVSDEDIRELAHKCSFFGKRTIGCVKKLDEKDMRNIYKNAK